MAASKGAMPELLAQLADALGEDLALRLADRLGGRRIWIRAAPDGTDALSRAMGLEDARSIARALGAGYVYVPQATAMKIEERNALIRAMRASGCTMSAIAADLHLSEFVVYRALGTAKRR